MKLPWQQRPHEAVLPRRGPQRYRPVIWWSAPVAVMGLGSVWHHQLGKGDARSCPTSPVYYNSIGVLVHGNSGSLRSAVDDSQVEICQVSCAEPHHPHEHRGTAIVGISRAGKDFSISLFEEMSRRGYDIVPVNSGASEI